MRHLELEVLADVVGGQDSSVKIATLVGSAEWTQSDYNKCVDTMTTQTRIQYPDTRPWWNPFASDDNAKPRAAATMANVGAYCGPPIQ